MPQSDSRATLAYEETQEAFELFREIPRCLHALLQSQASLAALMAATEEARLRKWISTLPEGSEERRVGQERAKKRGDEYGMEVHVSLGDEPHDLEILAQASRSAAIKAGRDIPALATALKDECIAFEGKCDALMRIAESVHARADRLKEGELASVGKAFEVVGLLRMNPFAEMIEEEWAEVAKAQRALKRLAGLLRAPKVTTKRKRKSPAVKQDRALTPKENLADSTVKKCGGNFAEAARQIEKSRQTVAENYKRAEKKLSAQLQRGRSVSAKQQLPEQRPRNAS